MELLKFDPEFPPHLTLDELNEIKWRKDKINICRQMIRKDFELLKIQNSFCQIFNNAEFFSQANDDVASIEHTILLAYGRAKENFLETHLEHLIECGLQLGFTCYSTKKNNSANEIEKRARLFTNIVFQSATFQDDYQGHKYFLKNFMKEFPELDMPWAKKYLNKVTKENWECL